MTNSTDSIDRITQRRASRKKKQKRNWAIKGIAAAVLLYLLLSIVCSFHCSMSTASAL